DKVLPESRVGLALDALESARSVDRAGRQQVALRPQHQLAVALAPRERDAFVREAPAQPVPARAGGEDQQSQLRDRSRAAHDEDRTHALAIDLGNPALLPGGIEVLDVLGGDAGDQALELAVETVFAPIDLAVLLYHPAHVAGARITQHDRARGRRLMRAVEQLP